MAGKQIGNAGAFNSLQSGLLTTHESRNPSSPRYANGLEVAEGAAFRDGRLMAQKEIGSLVDHAFPADHVPFPDNSYYKRNTASTTPTYTTIPNDTVTSAASPDKLVSKLSKMMLSGNFLSCPTSDPDSTGKLTNGGWSSFDKSPTYTATACKVMSASEVVDIGGTVKFVRAVSFNDGTRLRWAVVGTKKFEKEMWYRSTGVSAFFHRSDDETTNKYTAVHGKASITTSTDDKTHGILGGYDKVKAKISVEPLVKTLSGSNFTCTGDVYLVGKMTMFSPSIANSTDMKNPRSYTYTADGHYGDASVKADWKSSSGDSPQTPVGESDVYILAWGSGFSGLDTTDTSLQTLGAEVDANNGFPRTSTVETVASNPDFVFAFNRNKTHLKRRVGVAVLRDVTGRSGADQSRYVGFTKLAGANGDGNLRGGASAPLTSPSATSPYIVALDGEPMWIETGYQGVFCGTSSSEYLISNESDATAYVLRKISSIGASPVVAGRDYADVSTQLNGSIYFITKTGVAHLQFSNEANAFIPRIFSIVDYGFSPPMSIASSKSGNCLYVHTGDNEVCVIYAETGVVAKLDNPAVLIAGAESNLFGVRTEGGEPMFIYQTGGSYKMARLSESTNVPVRIRTTRFFAGQERVPKINKVYVYLSDSFGGRVRVEGQGDDGWATIQYTAEEMASWSTNGPGFTGVKEVYVQDSSGDHGVGKSIEIEFASGDRVNLIGVSVGGDQ